MWRKEKRKKTRVVGLGQCGRGTKIYPCKPANLFPPFPNVCTYDLHKTISGNSYRILGKADTEPLQSACEEVVVLLLLDSSLLLVPALWINSMLNCSIFFFVCFVFLISSSFGSSRLLRILLYTAWSWQWEWLLTWFLNDKCVYLQHL